MYALHRPTTVVVEDLRRLLGARLVAYIAGVSSTVTTVRWAEGAEAPSHDVERRLRVALQVALVIDVDEVARQVTGAARAFLASG